MKNLILSRCALSVWVTATLLVGCSGSQAQVGAPGVMPQAKMPPPSSEHRYVIDSGDNKITVYKSGAEHPELTISQGIDTPTALAFDSSNNLYVANYGNNTVTVYANGSNVVKRTITKNISDPLSPLFVADELYVADYTPPAVTVYSTAGTYLSSFPKVVEHPEVLAANSSGTVFVGNQPLMGDHGTVTVYNSSKNTLVRTITDGIVGPYALALDGSGDLYVANLSGSTVTEYAPESEKFFRQLTAYIPNSLALDGSGNLYVAEASNGSFSGDVVVYAPGSTSPLRTITNGINSPFSLAFGPSGSLNVANGTGGTNGSITGYAPGSGKVAWTITNGINYPTTVTFGP